MKYMLLLKASAENQEPDAGHEERQNAMKAFNEQLVRAGVVLACASVATGEPDARVQFQGEARTVADRPGTVREDDVEAFWILQVASQSEAVEWARRIPATSGYTDVHRVREAGERKTGERGLVT